MPGPVPEPVPRPNPESADQIEKEMMKSRTAVIKRTVPQSLIGLQAQIRFGAYRVAAIIATSPEQRKSDPQILTVPLGKC